MPATNATAPWRLLAIQLISALQVAELRKFRDGQWGSQQQHRFEVTVAVVGLNGRTMPVTAGWQIQDDAPAQLVTIVPGDKIPGAVNDVQAIVPGDLASLYNMAVAVAQRALQGCRPTAIAVGGPKEVEAIAEGMAGFAWVRFPDARAKFVRWLLRAGHATKTYPGAQISAPNLYIEPATAWAEAMAGVLQAAGHPCSVVQVLD